MTGKILITFFLILFSKAAGTEIIQPGSEISGIDRNITGSNYTGMLYNNLSVHNSLGMPSYEVFSLALAGYNKLSGRSEIRKNMLTIIDFSKSSCEKRLWVIDLDTRKVLFNELVAHGRNSGDNYASRFSNDPNTNMSSLGFYITGETYTGKHGLSLSINGMDRDFNNNARERAIVIHGADYVSEDYIRKYGRIGRSLGCPSLGPGCFRPVIETISEGSCLFIYYPDGEYLKKSTVLNS